VNFRGIQIIEGVQIHQLLENHVLRMLIQVTQCKGELLTL